MKKPMGLMVAIGIPKKDKNMDEENMNEQEPRENEVHEDADGDIDCYAMPEGMNVEDGQTVNVPAEMEFEARDGKLYIKRALTIDGKPAEPMEEEKEEGNELENEENEWREKARKADEQVGMGNQ